MEDTANIMKKNKKVTLYSNEITEEKIDSARQYLLEEKEKKKKIKRVNFTRFYYSTL